MKRKFTDLRGRMLKELRKTQLTRMELSRKIVADYRTVERHLIWLCGEEKVKRIKEGKRIYYRAI